MGKRYADAIAVGEADNTWPQIVEDAANGCLKELYEPVDAEPARRSSPASTNYPDIAWTELDLDQFNMVPKFLRPRLQKTSAPAGAIVPRHPDRVRPRLPLRL